MTSFWKTEKGKARKRAFVILCHLALAKKFDGDIRKIADFRYFGVERLLELPMNLKTALDHSDYINDMLFLLNSVNEYLEANKCSSYRDEVNMRGNYRKMEVLQRLRNEIEDYNKRQSAFYQHCVDEMKKYFGRNKDD